MPAFNAQDTVGEAIRSVLSQTHKNLELIIVDDGSDDDTLEVAKGFKDSRIRLIRHDKNRGQGAARNTAIAVASGDWITLIDADDFWASERLEKLLNPLEALGNRVIIADDIYEFYQVNAGIKPWRRVWERQIDFANENTQISLARYLSYSRTVMQPLIPRKAVIEHKLRYPTDAVAEDLDFYIRLMKVAGLKLHFIDFPGYYYRQTPGSISTHPQKPMLVKRVLENILADIDFDEDEKTVLHKKIDKLNEEIEYRSFVDALRKRQAGKLLMLLFSRPQNLIDLIRRVPATVYYRFHVLIHKGTAR